MADKAKGTTNDTPSCVPVDLTCTELWSLAQQFAYLRLCEVRPTQQTGLKCHNIYTEDEVDLLDDYRIRAKRIAATYARLYLETEKEAHCDPFYKGRHPWYAFGAFASKVVFCVLDFMITTQQNTLPAVPFVGTSGAAALEYAIRVFGKGNFWLFMDIAPPGWVYNLKSKQGISEDFKLCVDDRSAKTFVPEVKTVIDNLPWAEEALPIIQQLKMTTAIKKGFSITEQIERAILLGGNTETQQKAIRNLQHEHLLAVAVHEQQEILQPLIYEGWLFRQQLAGQRLVGYPEVKMAFSHACDAAPDRENVASKDTGDTEGTKVEVYESRMDWIKLAAADLSKLLFGTNPAHVAEMEAELGTIASWVDLPDPPSLLDVFK